MTQTQLEEFRKWVEEKPGRSAEIYINYYTGKPVEEFVWVHEVGFFGQMVKCVDEINLETPAKQRLEELKRKLEEKVV